MTTAAQKVARYIRLRDYKKAADDEFKKSMERVNAAMRTLESELLEELNTLGVDRIGSDDGTAYRKVEMSCTTLDRDEFLRFCRENEEWDALDVKANKTYVRAMLEEGRELPPGVKVSTFETVGIRR